MNNGAEFDNFISTRKAENDPVLILLHTYC